MNKTRTITLTDRAPVSIVESDWPIIAEIVDRPEQLGARATIKVREHKDGRRIVYGTASKGWPKSKVLAAGFVLELFDAPSDTAPKITAVGLLIGRPELSPDCISKLPVEALS